MDLNSRIGISISQGLNPTMLRMREEFAPAAAGQNERIVAGNVRRLQAQLARVEELITPGAKTDLLTLLESLAADAGLSTDQIDSVTPKPPSSNDRYPETRVEVKLKGATLKQLVQLLHKIETARLYLIVRSLRIKTRGREQQILDVSFSVSSFERA